tara:strand:+ start:236 stop:532 length:297 start_codon:yes stop_codon:yes gene_type:complete
MNNEKNVEIDNHGDDSMIIDEELYTDLFYDPSMDTNVTIYDDFFDCIDKSIITGDTIHIEGALKRYGNQLHQDSIKMASNIIIQILEEKMEDIIIQPN